MQVDFSPYRVPRAWWTGVGDGVGWWSFEVLDSRLFFGGTLRDSGTGDRGSGGGGCGGLSAPAANRTPIPWRLRAKERWCFFMSRC